MAEYHDEQTLFKVRRALEGETSLVGEEWLFRMSPEDAEDAIRRMQNAGIVFRQIETAEQASKRIIEEVTSNTEVNTWEIPEEMLLTRDQGIRVQAIDIAVRSITPAEGFGDLDGYTQKFITRAEMFEEYIRNGVIHNA